MREGSEQGGLKVPFVLVHGGSIPTDTWNRLTGRSDYPPGGNLGGRCWDGTVRFLESHGHRAFAPTLSDEHTTDLSGHVAQVCTIITQNDLRDMILVGHSYGGMVITGVAAGVPGRVRGLVYLDAALPDPGESLFDLFAAAGCDPVAVAGLDAARAYGEKIRFDPAVVEPLPKTYIRCTKSEFLDLTRLAWERAGAAPRGWTRIELSSSHVPMADLPDEWYRVLLGAVTR